VQPVFKVILSVKKRLANAACLIRRFGFGRGCRLLFRTIGCVGCRKCGVEERGSADQGEKFHENSGLTGSGGLIRLVSMVGVGLNTMSGASLLAAIGPPF
jgi:hypothetical protein